MKPIYFIVLLLSIGYIPMLVMAIFWYFNLNDMTAKTTLLESAMPPMITAGILAANAGCAPRLSSTLVGYGILFSLFTVPLFSKLFNIFIQ